MPAPLVGYNNNVRHRGRIFHIQTEDSGVGTPRIVTHLFADGGRIVKSTRTDYSEHVGRPEMVDIVRNLMKDQHKAMFVALRSGELDSLIGFEPEAELAPKAAPAPPSADPAAAEVPATPPESPSEKPPSSSRKKIHSAGAPPEKPAPEPSSKVATPPPEKPGGRLSERPYAPPRPAAIFSVPPSGSIFGDVGNEEKSLDEAILSYLSEDPEPKP